LKNPYILLLLTMLIYAGNLLVGKTVTAEMPPFTLAFLRFCVALLFMIPLGMIDIKKNSSIWKKEWKLLIVLSLTGIVFFNALIYFSLVHTTSINAGIIQGLTPIYSVILSYFILKERLTKIQLGGVMLSLIGVFWVITKGSVETIRELSFNIGDLTMCLAMFSWAVYSVFIKQHNKKFPLHGLVLMMMLIGVVFLMPLAMLEWKQLQDINWNASVILSLLYVGIFPSVVALLFWNLAVKEIGPSRSSVFINLVPVFTAIGAILLLGESMSLIQVLGGLLVLVGVYMTTRVKAIKMKELSPGKSF
jgi:drug/metabolite transporter (DMT)-like permease